MDDDTILLAIPSTEPATFFEFIRNLENNAPERGDKGEWCALFLQLERLEQEGLIEVERDKGRISALQLTPDGADRIRAKADARRGLFSRI